MPQSTRKHLDCGKSCEAPRATFQVVIRFKDVLATCVLYVPGIKYVRVPERCIYDITGISVTAAAAAVLLCEYVPKRYTSKYLVSMENARGAFEILPKLLDPA